LNYSTNPGELSVLLIYRGAYERALELSRVYRNVGSGRSWRQILKFLVYANKGKYKTADSLGRFLVNQVHPNRGFELLLTYELAQVEFELGKLDEAAANMQHVQELKAEGLGFRSRMYARSYYWLGRIYEAKGNPDLARQNYSKFLALWHRADPDLPELVDAKRRLAGLL